jgi:hypothetical protein
MMQNMGSMMAGMGIVWLLAAILLILGIVTLVKSGFSRRQPFDNAYPLSISQRAVPRAHPAPRILTRCRDE